jgi:hypothetical protein
MSNARFGLRTRTGQISDIVQNRSAKDYLLDNYQNAAMAYSLRLLRNEYAGSAIRVRRSNDNAEQDIAFNNSGNLDTTTLSTFVGANNGFVVTWYDQSGNGYNATQSTAGNQPQIVSSGNLITENGKITISFDGTSDFFGLNTTMANSFSNSTNKTLIAVYKHTAINGIRNRVLFFGNNTTTRVSVFSDSLTSFRGTFNGFANSVDITFNVSQQFLAFGQDIGGTQTFYLNSTTSGTNNLGGTNNDINVAEISNFTNLQYIQGSVQEMIFWSSNQSSNRTGIESNINDYYAIY